MNWAITFHTKEKEIVCEEVGDYGDTNTFKLSYDKLIIGVGCKSNTFNIPGVEDYAYFFEGITRRTQNQRPHY